MKLTYVESRPSKDTVSQQELAVINPENYNEEFTAAILAEVKVCLDNDAYGVAKELIDWHEANNILPTELPVSLTYVYDKRTSLTGVWSLTA